MNDTEFDRLVEELLEKPYYVIDFLPRQVPAGSEGQYFAVERFYLEHTQTDELYRKFAHLIIMLNCYYDIIVGGQDEPVKNPVPQKLYERISGCRTGEYFIFLLPYENALITLSEGDLYMTLYNPAKELLETITPIAQSQGLFVRTGNEGNKDDSGN